MSKTCNTQYAVMYKSAKLAHKPGTWPWYFSYSSPYDLRKANGADEPDEDPDDWDDDDTTVAVFNDVETANKLAAYYNSKQKANPYWEYAVFRTNFRRVVSSE